MQMPVDSSFFQPRTIAPSHDRSRRSSKWLLQNSNLLKSFPPLPKRHLSPSFRLHPENSPTSSEKWYQLILDSVTLVLATVDFLQQLSLCQAAEVNSVVMIAISTALRFTHSIFKLNAHDTAKHWWSPKYEFSNKGQFSSFPQLMTNSVTFDKF